MLKLDNIHVSFDNQAVLKGLSLEVKAGDFIVVTGHNGAGKSTLFDVISGKIRPHQGQVLFDNTDVTSLSERQRAPMVGRLQQNVSLSVVPSMTVAENLSLATYKGKTSGFSNGLSHFPHHVIQEILEPLKLNLENLLQTPIGKLSGGQRQIIALIMATLVKPRILLLDEPTAALDPKSAQALMEFAKTYIAQHQLPTLLITHDTTIAQSVGNKRVVLEGGVLVG